MATALSVLASLGFVLALLGVCVHLLRRVHGGTLAPAPGRIPLQVVQRVALGPRQGIAVVRVGERLVAVSVGDGGVRTLLELDADQSVAPQAAPPAGAVGVGLNGADFLGALRGAMRSAAPVLLLALALGTGSPAAAHAQAAPAQAAGRPVVERTLERQPSSAAVAQTDTMLTRLAPSIDLRVGDASDGGLRLSGTVGVVVMMGLLTLLPTLLLLMTSFTRILVVLHFLRQALGTQNAPPAHLLAALALLLTGFVMAPTLSEANQTALQPWMNGQIDQAEMLSTGVRPFRTFMLAQTGESELSTFLEMSPTPDVRSADEVPLVVLMSAFAISELKAAFQIGFALFLPFIVIDLVVASVLMSMGMFMLPPAMIALPFKLLLFVLVDGWTLVVQGLVASFR